jgi:hypothetical protein
VAVQHVKVNEVAEDESGWAFTRGGGEFGHAVGVGKWW